MLGDSAKTSKEEYNIIAKKLIAKITPRSLKYIFLNDDQVVGDIVTELMLADESYNELKNTRHMWRYLSAYWAIQNKVKLKCKENREHANHQTPTVEDNSGLISLIRSVKIPEIEKISMLYLYEDGYSLTGVARMFKCSTKKVEKRANRAINKVRNALKPYI